MHINYSGMFDITEILEKFKEEHDFDKTIRSETLFKFWKQICGKKFENDSKCVALSGNYVLTVACKNSLVSSELLMFKDELIRKVNVYANPLGLSISDVVFSHRIWKDKIEQDDTQEVSDNAVAIRKKTVSEEELNAIDLNSSEIEEIENSVLKATFASEQQKEKMIAAIIKNLKIQKFMKLHNK